MPFKAIQAQGFHVPTWGRVRLLGGHSTAIRWGLALTPILAAFAVQYAFWEGLRPFSWFLFYPAVFLSSWIGGLRAGLASTAVATAVVWVFFIPPEGILLKAAARYIPSSLTFLLMGTTFAFFHDWLRIAEQKRELAYEDLKTLEKLKSEFFTNVSHELRTPLTLVLGPAERLLASSNVPAPLRADLDVIVRNARTMQRHVEDLLDAAKLDAGQLQPVYAHVDVAGLARLAAGHFDALAVERSMRFRVDLPAELAMDCDAGMLLRILVNLLSNAFKFTPRGGLVRLTVRSAGDRLVLEVADSGPGVPAAEREAVFERFHQLDSRVARQFGGTGLGLSIVRELARAQGGTATARAAPEGGALFVVEIPLSAPPHATVASGAPLPAFTAATAHAVQELRAPVPAPVADAHGEDRPLVIIAEDSPDMLLYVRAVLAPSCAIHAVDSGPKALALALEHSPALVITDVMMPGGGGDELVRAMRAHRSLDATPILVLTARDDEAMRVRLLREGAQDYLLKPFSVDELRARAGNLIARHRAEVEARTLSGQLDAVSRAMMAVSDAVARLPGASLESVLHMIALQAQMLTSAEYVAVGIGTDPERPFSPWVQVGMPADVPLLAGRAPRPRGVLGLVAVHGQHVRTPDIRTHPAFIGLPEGHPPVTSLVGVPIHYQGRPVGNLYLGNKRHGPEFTDVDQKVVEMMAARAGSAIETAGLYASLGIERTWLKSVIQQTPEPILLVDRVADRLVLNGAACALLGWREQPADGSAAVRACRNMDLRRPDGTPLEREKSPLWRALECGEPASRVELIVHRPDGTRVPVLMSAVPVTGASGERTGAVAVFHDITTSKQLQSLREQWMGLVAHDLRQPVTVMAMTVDDLAEALGAGLPEEDAALVKRLRAQVTRLNAMIEDLLDFAQIEAGHVKVCPRPVDLPSLVDEVVQATSRTLKDRAIRIETRSAPPPVFADPARIEQALTNLLVNAGKYGEPGTEIVVELDGDPAGARVAVANRGRGIAGSALPHVFDRFYRAPGAEQRAKGLGLGLFIVRGIVEAHGGRIGAESTPGETTRFWFTLPAVRSPG